MKRIAFMGSKPLGLAVLRTVANALQPPDELGGVVCAEDRHDGRSNLDEFAAFADTLGVELHIAATTAEALAALRRWRTSLAIVCGWYRILPVDEVKNCDFYGIHASPLPRYRGHAPIVWQIIQGEPRIGLSFFKLDEGLDSGAVVAQVSFELARDQGVGEALRCVEAHAVTMIEEHLPRLLGGAVTLHEQDHTLASYCGPRRPEDGIIDWSRPAIRVHDFVRGQSRPYPGAFGWLGEGDGRHRVIVWRTAVYPHPYVGVPGRLSRGADGEVVVACGSGAVQLIEGQIEDEPTMNGDELYRAASRLVGLTLLNRGPC